MKTPIKAINIDTIVAPRNFSLRKKKASMAVRKGMIANMKRVIAAVTRVIEKINPMKAKARHTPPIKPGIPARLKLLLNLLPSLKAK